MKRKFQTKKELPIRLRYYLSGAVALWTVLIGLSLAWNLRTQDSGILEAARIEARTAFEKDVIYRRWNAGHDGVYAPVTGVMQPNSYLNVPERDITTPLGKKLTKINPAYMTRQIHELALKENGVRGHITSLNPIRPANVPDPWETRALRAFQAGGKEVSSVEKIEGNNYMRLMRPLLTEKGCLKCHAAQGYKLGDIRGGISVSIPMAPLMAISRSHNLALSVGHVLLWLAGLAGIGLAFHRLNRQIHKHMGTEEALRESDEKYRLLADNVTDNIWILDLATLSFTYVSPSVVSIMGYSVEEATGLQLQDVLTPSSMKLATEILSEELSEESRDSDPPRSRILELEQYRKDGTTVWTEVSTTFIRDIEGRPSSILGVTRDITGRKLAEDKIARFGRIFQDSLNEIYLFDADTLKFTQVNNAAQHNLGYTMAEFREMTPLNLKPEFTTESFEKMVAPLRKGEKEKIVFETVHKRKDQSHYDVEVHLQFLKHEHEALFAAIILDRTERRQAEEDKKKLETQLQRAQKMEAIGTLAGGVAHDLNNILGGLVSYPELLLLQLPIDSPLRKSILTIKKSGEKAAAVVQDLLTLARRGVVVTEVVNLNDVVDEYLKSPEHEKLRSYHPGVHMETHIEKGTLNILGSSTHLSKTVMNLISNAAEAMPEGGTLTVSTENRYIDRPIRNYDDLKEGDYVVLTISDTGIGISPDDMEKIFEPFYTKKKMGISGTGLGMAVVWGTVKDHNGYIDVQSTKGKGTTFTLYFPVTRKELPEDRSDLAIESYSGNGESILIVDDVAEQREIASGMLKELGYSVVSVSSGEEAVEYLKTNKVDLLVLDMIMDPGMDGLDTYKKIIEIHPGQKAIIASGFSETDRVKAVQSLGARAYIRKPLLLEKMGLAVKKELGK